MTIIIQKIIQENTDKTAAYKRNLVKEYLQVLTLDYLYSSDKYNSLVFYGGSCLFHFYALPRLSEDLDFVDIKQEINLKNLADDLKTFFSKKLDFPVAVKLQKFRIYLKFPVLSKLGFAARGESDYLFLKVEIFSDFNFCSKYKIEAKPLFKYNKTVLARVFDLPTLMATKIRAILYRKWEKTDKTGNTLISVKGRDYFDLMWYLEKGIKPNLSCVGDKMESEDLKNKLIAIVNKIDYRSIVLDLENFISDREFVKNLGKNIKAILTGKIKEM